MKLKTLVLVGCGIFLASSAAFACSGPGAANAIQGNVQVSRIAFAVGLLVLAIQAMRLYRRISLVASAVLVVGYSALHPMWWISPLSGDCGRQAMTTSVAFTIAAAVISLVLARARSEGWRTLIAFALAPVLPCALVALALSALSSDWDDLSFLLVAMLAAREWLIAVLAVPTYFAVKHFYKPRPAQCVTAGAFVGLVPAVIYVFLGPSGEPAKQLQDAVASSAFGATVGGCFWALAFYRRQPEDTKHGPIADA